MVQLVPAFGRPVSGVQMLDGGVPGGCRQPLLLEVLADLLVALVAPEPGGHFS